MRYEIELNDEMLDLPRSTSDPIRRAKYEMSVLAAVDLELADLRQQIVDHVLGNVKEPA